MSACGEFGYCRRGCCVLQRRNADRPTSPLPSAEFPTVTYVGKTFSKTDDTHGTIVGDMTIRGVTKPVTLNVTLNKAGQHPMTKDEAVGFDATGTFKRSDFGIKTYLPYIGDEISVDISTEAHAAK